MSHLLFGINRIQASLLAALVIGVPSVSPAELMPAAQQNALVMKYCAVCHTDAVKNGGLTLQHFDAATAAPSLAAMLTSKLTGGSLLHTAQTAANDSASAAYVGERMKGGAMGAAGLGVPDKVTIFGLIDALATRARGAEKWYVEPGRVTTASVLRELPKPNETGQGSSYRLIVTCDAASGAGEVQLAWSPSPKRGTFTSLVDGQATATHQADGSEKMGNGSKAETGPAALTLFTSTTMRSLPSQTLQVSELFAGETVAFPFGELSSSARHALATCFGGSR